MSKKVIPVVNLFGFSEKEEASLVDKFKKNGFHVNPFGRKNGKQKCPRIRGSSSCHKVVTLFFVSDELKVLVSKIVEGFSVDELVVA